MRKYCKKDSRKSVTVRLLGYAIFFHDPTHNKANIHRGPDMHCRAGRDIRIFRSPVSIFRIRLSS